MFKKRVLASRCAYFRIVQRPPPGQPHLLPANPSLEYPLPVQRFPPPFFVPPSIRKLFFCPVFLFRGDVPPGSLGNFKFSKRCGLCGGTSRCLVRCRKTLSPEQFFFSGVLPLCKLVRIELLKWPFFRKVIPSGFKSLVPYLTEYLKNQTSFLRPSAARDPSGPRFL